MTEVIIYLIKSAVVMTFLYLAYKWLMAGSTFHAFNRGVLLTIYLMSWLLPLLLKYNPSAETVGNVEVGMPVVLVDGAAGTGDIVSSSVDWPRVTVWGYLCGAAITAAFTIAGAVKLCRLIIEGEKEKRGDYTLVVNPSAPSPMSWGKYVIVRPSDFDTTLQMVLAHELKHKSLKHWLDLILTQVTVIFQWFSPSAWLMMRELRLVHEFQVDSIVPSSQRVEYQLMLLKKTVGTSFPTIADSLNHSQIKIRITMMMTRKSKSVRRMTAMMLPVTGMAALFVLSQPIIADQLQRLKPDKPATEMVTSGKVTKNSSFPQISRYYASAPEYTEDIREAERIETEKSVGSQVASVNFADREGDARAATHGSLESNQSEGSTVREVKEGKTEETESENVVLAPQKIAEYKGGMVALIEFLTQNIFYPEAVKSDKAERVIVQFVIDPDGTVSNARIMRGSSHPDFNKVALDVVNKTSGNWIPAANDGVPVASKFTIPITFKQK